MKTVQLKDLRVGDKFVEVSLGNSVEYQVIINPVMEQGIEGRNKYTLIAKGNQKGDGVQREVVFMETEGLEFYGDDKYRVEED